MPVQPSELGRCSINLLFPLKLRAPALRLQMLREDISKDIIIWLKHRPRFCYEEGDRNHVDGTGKGDEMK